MRLLLVAICLLLTCLPTSACFGPKLYVGVGSAPEQRLLFELAALYVKEKTGTESERVEVADAAEALQKLQAEQLDLVVLADGPEADGAVLLAVPGDVRLLSGFRPLNDLQFTLVAPALARLQQQFTAEHFRQLRQLAADGLPPAAAARRLLTEQGWI